jgi:hypothetical protein
MNISSTYKKLNTFAVSGSPKGPAEGPKDKAPQEPKDTMTFSQWFNSDEPASASSVKKTGAVVGLLGIASTAAGVLTNNPGLVIGGMMGGMTGLTVAYAAHKAG